MATQFRAIGTSTISSRQVMTQSTHRMIPDRMIPGSLFSHSVRFPLGLSQGDHNWSAPHRPTLRPVSSGFIPGGPHLVRSPQAHTPPGFLWVYPRGITLGPLPTGPHSARFPLGLSQGDHTWSAPHRPTLRPVSPGFIPGGPQLIRYSRLAQHRARPRGEVAITPAFCRRPQQNRVWHRAPCTRARQAAIDFGRPARRRDTTLVTRPTDVLVHRPKPAQGSLRRSHFGLAKRAPFGAEEHCATPGAGTSGTERMDQRIMVSRSARGDHAKSSAMTSRVKSNASR